MTAQAQATRLDSPSPGGCALSWSGGKDSALALRELRRESVEPVALLATVTEGYERISMHGVRRELLLAQSEAAGLPLLEVRIPPGASNETYEARLTAAIESPPLAGVESVAFGDLFLEDIRAYRERVLSASGTQSVFPVWGRPTDELARDFIAAGFRAHIACLDPRVLDPSFAGRPFDERLLAELHPTSIPVVRTASSTHSSGLGRSSHIRSRARSAKS